MTEKHSSPRINFKNCNDSYSMRYMQWGNEENMAWDTGNEAMAQIACIEAAQQGWVQRVNVFNI